MEKIARENITPDQRRELVDFIKLHPQLNSGKFTNEFTFKKAQELWQSLANNLNAFPAGAHKDWKKWRKTWHDIKTRTKSKSSMIKQHRKRTGGGPPTAINITTQEEEVLGIMGQVIVDGHPGISESLVEFDVSTMLPDQTTIDHDYAFGVSQIEDSEVHEEENSNIADENDPPLEVPPVSKWQSSGKTKRPRRIQRLEQTISATSQLAAQTEREISLRENYYKRKNELYEQDITAKLRIASALERIAKCKEDRSKTQLSLPDSSCYGT